MKSAYIQGYVAAAVWGWGKWMNPWPVWFIDERRAWNDGFDDAVADRTASRFVAPVLEPECPRPHA